MLRIDAISGGMQSFRETTSVLKCWSQFAVHYRFAKEGAELLPSFSELMAWSRMFPCSGAFGKYTSKLKLACELPGVSTEAFKHESLKRSKQRIKAIEPLCKTKHFITMSLLEQLLEVVKKEGDMTSSMLYIMSYAFLLRVPSEALPCVIGCKEEANKHLGTCHSRFYVINNSITIELARRKNMPNGACITRKCWCSNSPSTCPVHQLTALLCNERVIERAFFHLKQQKVNFQIKRKLCRLKIKDACEYRTHDFRRGHARDIHSSNNPLA